MMIGQLSTLQIIRYFMNMLTKHVKVDSHFFCDVIMSQYATFKEQIVNIKDVVTCYGHSYCYYPIIILTGLSFLFLH